jgi:hypothetical protein
MVRLLTRWLPFCAILSALSVRGGPHLEINDRGKMPFGHAAMARSLLRAATAKSR